LLAHVDRRASDAAGFAAAILGDAAARVDLAAMRPAGQAALVARTARIDLAGQSLRHATERATSTARERITTGGAALQHALVELPRAASLDVPRERLRQASAAVRHTLALRTSALTAAADLIRARDWRERGFALVRLPDGGLLRDATALTSGQTVSIEVKGATLDATIDAINPDPTEGDA
jgi:exodeoxyribonuclease VII large subunit